MSASRSSVPVGTIGALDIGTNSVLLLLARVSGGAIERVVFDGERNPRLGQGLGPERRLQPEAIARTADAVASLMSDLPTIEPVEWRAAGTSALRDAVNRAEAIAALRSRTEIEVAVIGGEREAELTFAGVCSDPSIFADSQWTTGGRVHPPDAQLRRGVTTRDRVPGSPPQGAEPPSDLGTARDYEVPLLVLADIGGGSTELTWGEPGRLDGAASADVGSSRLLRSLDTVDPPPVGAGPRLRDAAASALKSVVGSLPASKSRALVLSGGTAKTLLDVEAGVGAPPGSGILRRDVVERRLAWLATASRAERLSLPGMPPERADTILAGTAIVLAMLDLLGQAEARVSRRGLRYGIALQPRWP